MPDLDELAAWLDDTGHQTYADDLRMAASDDAPAIAYAIADQMDCEPHTLESHPIPAQLRSWADTQETHHGSNRPELLRLPRPDAGAAAGSAAPQDAPRP